MKKEFLVQLKSQHLNHIKWIKAFDLVSLWKVIRNQKPKNRLYCDTRSEFYVPYRFLLIDVINSDLFHLSIVYCTFYLAKDKIQYLYNNLFARRMGYITIPWYTAVLTWAENCTKIWEIWEYILPWHKLLIARNTNIWRSFLQVKEYFVSENALYRCADGFNTDWISPSENKQYGRQFSAVKIKHFLTRVHLTNDGWFYVKDLTRSVRILTGNIFRC